MSKSNNLENRMQLFMFNGTAITLPNTVYFQLHTADPGEAGNQSTSEATYTGYARVAKARNSGTDFTVTGNTVTNATTIQFPTCTAGGPEVLTHWSLGEDAAGGGVILYKGALSSPITVNVNSAPFVEAGSLTITED